MPRLRADQNVINPEHPLNKGLDLWLMAGMLGQQKASAFRDLTRLRRVSSYIYGSNEHICKPADRPGGLMCFSNDEPQGNGSTLYVEDWAPAAAVTNITVCCWGYWTNYYNPGTLVQRYNTGGAQRAWRLIGGGAPQVAISRDGTYGASTAKHYKYPTNIALRWVHTAFTFSPNELMLYIDGVQYTSSDLTLTYDATVNSIYASTDLVGIMNAYAGSTALDGRVDDIRIWNRTLSPNEMSEVYKNSMNGYTDVLLPLGGRRSVAATPAAGFSPFYHGSNVILGV